MRPILRPSSDHGIPEQNSAYRRGLVLGLTLAEAGLLIIFVLLLLLAFGELLAVERAAEARDKELVPKERLAALEKSSATLVRLSSALGEEANPRPEDVERLIRTVLMVARTPEGESALAAVRAELAGLREAKARLSRATERAEFGGSKELVDQLAEQASEIGNKEGQLARYEEKLKSIGLGKGERPCWVQPDGKIEFLYDVILQSDGLRIREIANPVRAADRALLPMPSIDPRAVLTEAEFTTLTRPLFDASVAQNCRFFVVIYDATGPDEKDRYKRLLRTVEGHFYKSLDNGTAGF